MDICQFQTMWITLNVLWYHCLIVIMYVAWRIEQFLSLEDAFYIQYGYIYQIPRGHFSAFWLCSATCSAGKLGDQNLFPAEQGPLYAAGCNMRFVKLVQDKWQPYLLFYMSWFVLTYFFTAYSITAWASPWLSVAGHCMVLDLCQPSLCWWWCCRVPLALILSWVWHG